MDSLDKAIINTLQKGFPVSDRPYHDAAVELGTTEEELLSRIQAMLDSGLLSRFGPMYQAENLGGAFCLCAMHIPDDEFDKVTAQVNGFTEVAHNYRRDHDYNMWFVLATSSKEAIATAANKIESEAGYEVNQFPKLQEFFVGLYLPV